MLELNLDLITMPADHLLKTKKEYKNFNQQEIHNIFIETNEIKLAFNMVWLMEILRIYLDPKYDE